MHPAPSLPVSCKRCASKALLEPIQQHKPAGTGLDACQASCLLLRSVHGTHAAAVLQAEQLGYERVPGVLPTPGGGRTVQAVAGSLAPAEGALLQPRVRLAVHVRVCCTTGVSAAEYVCWPLIDVGLLHAR